MLLLSYSLSSSALLSPKDVRRLSMRCLDVHWHDPGFVCMKVDMKNAFNLVSRQSLLDQCVLHFPLLPWTEWCYSQHPFLWHSMGTLTSEAGVQQGDPLGPFYFTLVLPVHRCSHGGRYWGAQNMHRHFKKIAQLLYCKQYL